MGRIHAALKDVNTMPDAKPPPWLAGIMLALIVAIVLGVALCVVPRLHP
jgi:hypothetical protein